MSNVSFLYYGFFFNDTATTEIYTLSLHDALPISVAPLRTGRGRPGTIAIAADITQSKRAQSEAAETARFREHFVGIVGHDLRNPLTAILTAAQLLLRHGGLLERQARTVSRIAASSE